MLFYLCCCLMLLFLVFFSSCFKTDLMIKKPVETIDTLQDLAGSSDYRALFPMEWNLWIRFRDSDDDVLKSIWNKATRETGNYKEAVISLSESKSRIDPFEMLRQLRQGRVFISGQSMNRFVVNAFCIGYDVENKANMTDIVYLSRKTFFPFLIMGIIRRESSHELKDRFNFILQSFNEHGFHDFYDKNPLGILRKTVEQKNCYQHMRLERLGDGSEQDVRPIVWPNVAQLLYDCLLLLCLSFVLLAFECSMLLIRRRRDKKVTPLSDTLKQKLP